MKKNRLIIIAVILLFSLFAFNKVTRAKAVNCDSGTCYCNSSGKCVLLRNPSNGYTINSDKAKCGCDGTNKKPSSSGTSSSSSEDGINLCQNAGVVKAAQVVGWMLFVIRIIAPLILIAMGIIELAKAVMASDDKAISAAITSLIKRAIAAVIIFFIPTIVALIFSVVDSAKEAKGEFKCLTECMNKPASCKIPSNELFK